MDFLALAGIGAAGNLGLGAVNVIAVPLMHWLQTKERPELKLSWGQLISVVLLSALAGGLAFQAVARFAFTADAAEAMYKALVPAIVLGLVLAQCILVISWHLKRSTPTLPVRLFVVLLVVWLVLGGGYLSILMSKRVPLGDVFWLLALAPALFAVAYLLIATTARWLIGKPTPSGGIDGKH